MKNITLLILITALCYGQLRSQENHTNIATLEIKGVLSDQENAWNNGNIEDYMQGYWKSDSLKFIGSKGIQYGWQATLDNYKKSYPDKATMGKLTFSEIKIELLSESAAFVIGKWFLKREKGDVGGWFTLLFMKKDKKWVIVCDHSS